MKLGKWQQQFTETLLHNDNGDALAPILSEYAIDEREARINIYKNNVFHSMIDALQDLYPSVHATLGNDFFHGCAKTFFRQNPPKSSAMVDFGADFPHFLNDFEHTAAIAYLPDLARLELARHTAYHASDATTLTPDFFASQAIDQLVESTIVTTPATQLIVSTFAIFSIWQFNQKDSKQQTALCADQPETVLVMRPEMDVTMLKLDKGLALFVSELLEGRTIGQALSYTLDHNENFEPTSAISFIIQAGFITALNQREQP